MAIQITTGPPLMVGCRKPSKSELNRQSNWTRHLNQSKSIRLRQEAAAAALAAAVESFKPDSVVQQQAVSAAPSPVALLASRLTPQRQPQPQRKPDNWTGRVSINHDAAIDYDGGGGRATRRPTTRTTTPASGRRNPMISSEVESKSPSNRRRRLGRLMVAGRGIGCAPRVENTPRTNGGLPLSALALMVASIVCCANLIGHCNCDTTTTTTTTTNGNNPFSGYHSVATAAATHMTHLRTVPSAAAAAASAQKSEARTMTLPAGHHIVARRYDFQVPTTSKTTTTTTTTARRKNQMEELLKSMAESVERQHLALGGKSAHSPMHNALQQGTKPSKFDSSSDGSRGTSSITRHHDDFLRDILASHERAAQSPARKSPNQSKTSSIENGGGLKQAGRFPAVSSDSKADQELRQIMMIHEHAGGHQQRNHHGGGDGASKPAGESAANADAPKAGQWPSKLFAKLQSAELIQKVQQVSMAPVKALKISLARGGQSLNSSAMNTSPLRKAASSPTATTATSAPSASFIGSAFTPRAHPVKNYLVGPVLGLGQMLLAQSPKPNRQAFIRDVGKSALQTTFKRMPQGNNTIGRKTVYSKPANEFKRAEAQQQLDESTTKRASSKESQRKDGSTNQEPPDTLDEQLATKPGGPARQGKPNKRNGWLVEGATNLAQTYFKDSFRDLLTLSQLPIFSSGPVSTAPSDLEPGGKKWLADKQAAEQLRGNRTNALEDLLRYVYILGNVGVRRKRDPLKALGGASGGGGSYSHARPPPFAAAQNALISSLATALSHNRRPLLSAIAGASSNTHKSPFITSLIKLPPPRSSSSSLSGSRLSSILVPHTSDQIKSRGVMWDMATDPTLAVTMFHLLERASVALPLGFLLMPFVHMVRHPLGGLNLGRILPARASHRSVDLEELVKRLDMVDKILSRSMRSTHREAPFAG